MLPNNSDVDLTALTDDDESSCKPFRIEESWLLKNIPVLPLRGYIHVAIVRGANILFGPELPQQMCTETPSFFYDTNVPNDWPRMWSVLWGSSYLHLWWLWQTGRPRLWHSQFLLRLHRRLMQRTPVGVATGIHQRRSVCLRNLCDVTFRKSRKWYSLFYRQGPWNFELLKQIDSFRV